MPAELLTIMAPVAITAGLGLVWGRLGAPFDIPMVTRLVFNIGTPALVFDALTRLDPDPTAFGLLALATAVSIGVFAAVGTAVLWATGLPRRSFLPALMFANTGNMGLPLCLFAFGPEGLSLAVGVFVVNAVLQFTAGALISAGTTSLGQLARTPVLYAVAVALPLMLGGVDLPEWITRTTELVGGMMIPLMLLSLGVSLARLQVRSLPRATALGALRLGMGLAVGLGLASALGLEGAARGVLIIQSAMPVAVFNYLFASLNQRRPDEVAGTIVTSTALSFATMPGLLWVALGS